ncbi:hypothetical protein [Gordonia sp. SID5947]|uniref:hypothetical protein n=1 Tax=Gordonia sp. SID5947 TaxID=2690315 RepID=UPI0031BBADD9
MIVDAPGLAYRIVNEGALDVPLPGHGDTAIRLRTLADFCHRDISVGRLVEAHLDADAILAEIAGERVGPDELWGCGRPNHPSRGSPPSSVPAAGSCPARSRGARASRPAPTPS